MLRGVDLCDCGPVGGARYGCGVGLIEDGLDGVLVALEMVFDDWGD